MLCLIKLSQKDIQHINTKRRFCRKFILLHHLKRQLPKKGNIIKSFNKLFFLHTLNKPKILSLTLGNKHSTLMLKVKAIINLQSLNNPLPLILPLLVSLMQSNSIDPIQIRITILGINNTLENKMFIIGICKWFLAFLLRLILYTCYDFREVFLFVERHWGQLVCVTVHAELLHSLYYVDGYFAVFSSVFVTQFHHRG